jgi:hypothetical protein
MKRKVEHEREPPPIRTQGASISLDPLDGITQFFITIHKTQLRRDYAAIRYYH